MTTTKEYLDLPPRELRNKHIVQNQLSLVGSGHRRIVAETEKHIVAMEAAKAKGIYGVHKISELERYAQAKFKETADDIIKIRDRAQGTPSEHYVNEFTEYMLKMTAQHTVGIVDMSAAMVGNEVARSPYPQEEEPRGFWARLLGF